MKSNARNFLRYIYKLKAKRYFRKFKSRIDKIVSIKNFDCIYLEDNVFINDYCKIDILKTFAGDSFEPKFIIEKNVIIGSFFVAYVTDTLKIGSETILAHNVTILTENHGMNPECEKPYHAQPLINKDVNIGKNCWIGCNVTICPGVHLGNNVIVGANSLVNKSFPDNVMIAGVPAKIIKKYNFEKHCWEKNS